MYNTCVKWFIIITLLFVQFGLLGALEVEARYTHGTFYKGVTHQPVLQLKLTGEPGEKVTALSFTSGETQSVSAIKTVRLGQLVGGTVLPLIPIS